MFEEGVLNRGQEENKSFVTIKTNCTGIGRYADRTIPKWDILNIHEYDMRIDDSYCATPLERFKNNKGKKQLNCPSFIFLDKTLKMHTLRVPKTYTMTRHSAKTHR